MLLALLLASSHSLLRSSFACIISTMYHTIHSTVFYHPVNLGSRSHDAMYVGYGCQLNLFLTHELTS